MLISVTLGILYRDGSSALVLDNYEVNEYMETVYNLMLAASCMVLTNDYLRLDKHLPRSRWYGLLFLVLSILLFVVYILTGETILFVLIDISILIILTMYLGIGFYLFRRTAYAKIYSLAYGPIMILAYDFYLSPIFGYHILDLSINQFRFGGVVDMLVFTYAIVYQSKVLSEENFEMKNKIYQYSQAIKAETENPKVISPSQYLMDKHNFTQQEIKVLHKISKGKVNKEIANDLNISVNTVKFHTRNIYKKLEINTRKEASLKYFDINAKAILAN